MLLAGDLLPAGQKALHSLLMKGHLIAQSALLGNVSFIYWNLMGLNICLPLLDASCLLLCTWLIGTSNIAVNRHIDFRGRCFLRWILCASPHIQKATAELEKMWRCSWCTSASSVRIINDNQWYWKASAPETNKSRRALLFEEKMRGGGLREINKCTNGSKKASKEQLPTVSSNPSSTGQQVILSGRSFKG